MTDRHSSKSILSRAQFDAQLLDCLPRIKQFTRQLTKDANVADDIVHSAVVKALSKWEFFHEDAPMMPWLWRIVRNCYLDHLRSKADNAWCSVTMDPRFEKTVPSSSNPAQAVEARQSLHIVAGILSNFTPRERDAVVGARYLDLSHKKLAYALGCSDGASRNSLKRGADALMHALASGDSYFCKLEVWAKAARIVPEDHPYYPIAGANQEIYQFLRGRGTPYRQPERKTRSPVYPVAMLAGKASLHLRQSLMV